MQPTMAATQRPATQEALVEPSGERPLWTHVPSCFLISETRATRDAVAQAIATLRQALHAA
jgi:hypothetical protein